ncbi:PadR family transcriptional regulator [Salinispira pacifica]
MLTDIIILAFLKLAPRHGYDIRKHVERILTGNKKLNTNLLYPALHRLEKRGAIEREPSTQRGRPPRHIYSITPAGDKLFLDLIASFGDAEAAKEEEFTTRVAFFDFIDIESRRVILDARRRALDSRITDRRSRRESVARVYNSPWIERIMTFHDERNRQELSWIEELDRLCEEELQHE